MTGWDWLGWIGGGVLALAGVWVLARALLLDRARGRRRCGKCWYDMSGVSGLRCPECGREFKAERQLLRTRRHKRWAAAGLLIVLTGAIAASIPRVAREGWLVSTPTPVLVAILSVWEDEGGELFDQMRGRLWTPAGSSSLSDWEQLLIARYCGRKLREGAAAVSAAGSVRFKAQIAGSGATASTAYMGGGATWEYLTILGSLGANARPALPELVAMMKSGDGFARQEAASVVGGMGDAAKPAVPALVEMLEGQNAADARVAVRVLGQLGPAAGAAAGALGRLIGDAGTGESMLVRAVSAAGAMGPAGRDALPGVLRVVEGGAGLTVRLVAVRAVGLIGHPAPEAVRRLAALVGHEDMAMRNAAARALERMGPGAAAAAPELERLLADEREFVREAAADALRAIGER